MNTKTSAFKKLYISRCNNKMCTRCGKTRDSDLLKCEACRTSESIWRKNTRHRRTQQERDYHAKNWDTRCCMHARLSDIKMKRPIDESLYITPERLRTLRLLQCNRCVYCDTKMQVINRKKPDGLTIERIKNSDAHNEDNCILSCHRCNCKRVGNKININKTNLQIFYEIKRKHLQGSVLVV